MVRIYRRLSLATNNFGYSSRLADKMVILTWAPNLIGCFNAT